MDAVQERRALGREKLNTPVGDAYLIAGGCEVRRNHQRRATEVEREHGALRRVQQGARCAKVRAAGDQHAILVDHVSRLSQGGKGRLVVYRPAGVEEADLGHGAGPSDSDRLDLADEERRLIGQRGGQWHQDEQE